MDGQIFADFLNQTKVCIFSIMDNLNIAVTNELCRLIDQKYGFKLWCYELFGVHGNMCDGGDLTAILTTPDFGFEYYYRSERKQILGDLCFCNTIFAGTSTLSYNHNSVAELVENNCMVILLTAEDIRQKKEVAAYGYTPIKLNLRKSYAKYARIIREKTAPLCDLVFDVTVKDARQTAEMILIAIENMLEDIMGDGYEDYEQEVQQSEELFEEKEGTFCEQNEQQGEGLFKEQIDTLAEQNEQCNRQNFEYIRNNAEATNGEFEQVKVTV